MRADLRRWVLLVLAAFLPCSFACTQQTSPTTLGTIEDFSPTQKLQISGNMALHGSTLLLGNGSAITAGAATLHIARPQGGQLNLCPTTQVHLTQAVTTSASAQASALLIALDHGALEDRGAPGAAPDVILTPDLRITSDAAGVAISIRVNRAGDTCVDNGHDAEKSATKNAAAITVQELLGEGVYRVRPGQRVLLERGSVESVVDNEPEPCGCPSIPIASAGVTSTKNPAQPGQTVAANDFPLAQSEGLAPTPAPSAPEPGTGQTHMQIASTLSYSGTTNRVSSPATEPAAPVSKPQSNATPASASASAPASAVTAQAAPAQQQSKHSGGLLHHIGHFFKKIFGKG